MTDWNMWRKCKICRANIGHACRTLSGRIVDGRPDGVATYMLVPHKTRQPRTRGLRKLASR